MTVQVGSKGEVESRTARRGNVSRKAIIPVMPQYRLFSLPSILFLASLILWELFLPPCGMGQEILWSRLDEGLSLAEIGGPPGFRDAKVTFLKIDPAYYAFKLLCASNLGRMRMTPREWSKRYHLVSAINAGMYQEDRFTNVGYMKHFSHVNNPRLNSTYQTVLCFNRVDPDVPEIQIADLRCQGFGGIRQKYQTFVQNIRLISCRQENVWAKQDKRWSLAVLGADREGKILFIFSEVPYSGHDFGNLLLSFPISLFNAMYLEGGPEAGFYLGVQGLERDKVGIHETGLHDSFVRPAARRIPNVIGIVKKKDE